MQSTSERSVTQRSLDTARCRLGNHYPSVWLIAEELMFCPISMKQAMVRWYVQFEPKEPTPVALAHMIQIRVILGLPEWPHPLTEGC